MGAVTVQKRGSASSEGRALPLAGSVRQRLLAEPSPAEAALASVDLGILLAESGRTEEIEGLAQALRTLFPDEALLIVSAGGLIRFAELALAGEPDPRLMARHTAATMRRTFRVARLNLRPMPFA